MPPETVHTPEESPEPAKAAPPQREERREREEERAANVAQLCKQAEDARLLLRRNPRNRELRARLNQTCRKLQTLGVQIPECL